MLILKNQEDLEFQNFLDFPKEDSNFQDFPEAEEGGFGPPKPPENNSTGVIPTSPRPTFRLIATMVANRPWLVVDTVVVP